MQNQNVFSWSDIPFFDGDNNSTFERRCKDNTPNAVLQGRLSIKYTRDMDCNPYSKHSTLICSILYVMSKLHVYQYSTCDSGLIVLEDIETFGVHEELAGKEIPRKDDNGHYQFGDKVVYAHFLREEPDT